jgi:LmbE family N-acetylglucosaminyl deacetylase
MTKRTLMAIFAHPDDETFGSGGVLAHYAIAGYRVVLVTATKGEAGDILNPDVKTSEPMVEIRQRELKCAAEILGIEGPVYLGYRDSGMAGTPDNLRPDSFNQVDLNEAVGKVVAHIRTYRPQVILTFEPGGGYGHPDHIKVSKVATEAFHAAGDSGRYPEQEQKPWQPSKLYYTARPRRYFWALAQQLRKEGKNPADEGWDPETRGMPDELVTTEVDVRDALNRKLEAYQCHRSQLSPNGFFSHLSQESQKVFMQTEYFWRVVPAAKPGELERDLFAGL